MSLASPKIVVQFDAMCANMLEICATILKPRTLNKIGPVEHRMLRVGYSFNPKVVRADKYKCTIAYIV